MSIFVGGFCYLYKKNSSLKIIGHVLLLSFIITILLQEINEHLSKLSGNLRYFSAADWLTWHVEIPARAGVWNAASDIMNYINGTVE